MRSGHVAPQSIMSAMHAGLSIGITTVTLAWAAAAVAQTDGASKVSRPWMVSEAALPGGFPGPGPVDEVIVKTYPAHRMARASAGKAADGMFMKLFRHIERNEIAMTAPVVMAWPEGGAGGAAGNAGPERGAGRTPESMAFLYGTPELGKSGVDPADPLVVVEDVPEATVVSIGMRGDYDERTADRGLLKIRAWLAAHPEWRISGAPRSLAYNSPFVPSFMKYSEVQVPITRTGNNPDAATRKLE